MSVEYTPTFVPRGPSTALDRSPGGQIAAYLLSNTLDGGVEFHATQNEAGHIRTAGTQWLRLYNTGKRLSVYRITPMDNPIGRAGTWEAVMVADMDAERLGGAR